MRVSQMLREMMAREKLSCAELSRKLGYQRTYMNAMLNQNTFKLETIERICDACGYDLSIKAVSRVDGFEFDIN